MAIKKSLGLGVVLGLLALAFAALPAFASAETLRNEAGTALKVGAALTGFSSNLTFAANSGVALECTENTLSGKVTSNGGSPAEASITSDSFTGTGGGECATNVPGLTATVTAPVESWALVFEPTDAFTLIEHIEFSAALKAGGTPIGTCVFTRGTGVHGTFTTSPSPATLTLGSGQTFAYVSGPAECGTEGTLTGAFSLTSGGGAVKITS